MIKKVEDPERFGVVELKGKMIVSIEEKPENPKSDYIVIGIYMYDNQVFDIIRTLKPSKTTCSRVRLQTHSKSSWHNSDV